MQLYAMKYKKSGVEQFIHFESDSLKKVVFKVNALKSKFCIYQDEIISISPVDEENEILNQMEEETNIIEKVRNSFYNSSATIHSWIKEVDETNKKYHTDFEVVELHEKCFPELYK